MIRLAVLFVIFVVAIKQAIPSALSMSQVTGHSDTASVSTYQSTSSSQSTQEWVRNRMNAYVVQLLYQSPSFNVPAMQFVLKNMPYHQSGKYTQYSDAVMRFYPEPQRQDEFISYHMGLLNMIGYLARTLKELEQNSNMNQRGAILVDMMDYVLLVTQIKNSLSSKSSSLYDPIKGMKELHRNKLSRDYWRSMKSMAETLCENISVDSQLKLSLPLIRLIMLDTRHRVHEDDDLDKKWDLYCAREIYQRDYGYPYDVKNDYTQNINILSGMGQ